MNTVIWTGSVLQYTPVYIIKTQRIQLYMELKINDMQPN